MSSTATTTTTTTAAPLPAPTTTSTTTSAYTTTTRHTLSRRRAPGFLSSFGTASTPNLNQFYSSSSSSSRLAPAAALQRKASFAALTPSSLASIPDDTEAYALHSVLTTDTTSKMPAPLTPGRLAPPAGSAAAASDDAVAVGDVVDVPGNMQGTVRFVGSVPGRKGTFAGVELHPEFASRGKNSGDVDGVFYFTTSQPGSGIFVPLSKAVRSGSAAAPVTPTPMTPGGGLKVGNQNSTNYTPPTPSLPKFSQSVGPGVRAPSPAGKRPRGSLPRPESPVRRLQLAGPRPSISATPGPKQQQPQQQQQQHGGGIPTARYGSPTAPRFAQSVRGTAGDPSKPRFVPTPLRERKPSISGIAGPRSASALGHASTAPLTDDNDGDNDDGQATPLAHSVIAARPTITNGSAWSVSSSLAVRGLRPPSRATTATATTASRTGGGDDEVERLRAQLEDRDRQLKEQAATLAEMESSLTELQTLIEGSDGPPAGLGAAAARRGSNLEAEGGSSSRDVAQLRALLREKNEKIAMLTAEFDAHRADFRSTIDTLEMASTETERVYEKRIEELTLEIRELQERTADVDNVAAQLKQLEELVQELEEGLEDARRGEAEARGEVEFLRGEVERTRSELRREREKAQAALANGSIGGSSPPDASDSATGGGSTLSKELEQKEDEIRGLKAIIHSLSRDPIPGGRDSLSAAADRTPTQQRSSSLRAGGGGVEDRLAREKLEREVAELRTLVHSKASREEELEHEIERLRRASSFSSSHGNGNHTRDRSSLRDSRGTVVLAPRSPELSSHHHNKMGGGGFRHSRGLPNGNGGGSSASALDTMHESDAYSTATETSTLWCEICETAGHDILTCTNMFGPQAAEHHHQKDNDDGSRIADGTGTEKTGRDVVREGLRNQQQHQHLHVPHSHQGDDEDIKPAPLSPVKSRPSPAPTPVRILPNPMDSGPVAGKESGVVDASKWCALCERDGHDSVDCPFEDAF